jgi:hypothetical protein
MEDRLSRLESEVQKLSRAVERLEERLDTLEATGMPERAAPPISAAAEGLPGPVPASDILSAITLFGRTLLVLGGGYFLRAMTDSGVLAPATGIALGLLYALFWMLMADRAGARRNQLNAAFHGAGAVLVAFPLLWETTVRFDFLAPSASALCLTLISLAAAAVAWRHPLRGFAWVTLVGAAVTGFVLILGTRQLVPFSLFLVGMAIVTYWLAERAEWTIVHWVVAGLADIAVGLSGLGVLIEGISVTGDFALAIQLSLLVVFLLSFAHRLFRRQLPPGRFELAQTGLVIVLGYGGSLLVSAPTSLLRILGFLGIAVAIVYYRASILSRTVSASGRLYLEGTAAGLMFLGSLGALLNPTGLLAIVGVGLTWLGARIERSTVSLQGALFILAAAFTSSIVKQAGYAFLAPASYAWPPLNGSWVLGLAAAAGAYALSASGAADRWWERWRLSKLVLLGILVGAAGGAILAVIVPLVAGTPGLDASAAHLATVRTAVLAVSSLILAALARTDRFREAAWLVYPVLLAGGIKLILEDFLRGRAATLFVALALYGTAVFVAPRLARDKR